MTTIRPIGISDRVLRKFRVDAARCNIRVGDHVNPYMVIGGDPNNGQPVVAGCYGRVVAIHTSSARDTLLLLIERG